MKDANQDFFKGFSQLLEARYPIIYLETSEFERVYTRLKDTAKKEKYDLYGWNIVDGLRKFDPASNNTTQVGDGLVDLEAVMQDISKRQPKAPREIFVLEGIHDYIEDKTIKTWLRKFGEELRYCAHRKHVILLSPIRCLPKELEKLVSVLDPPLPNRSDLTQVLNQVALDGNVDIDPGLRERLVQAAMGMTESEADLAFCLAYAREKLGINSPSVVMKEKEQIVKKSGILEYYPQTEQATDVGGLEHLKSWLLRRGMAFSTAARNFQLSEPKGILLLGVPGCGKSLTAKAIASMWQMPLVRMDIGKVFEGIVGSSESNVRLAIKTAEAVAPCILWIDEIEKGLAGTGSSGSTDSGVTARVFSNLLTWMQEKTAPVFIVATANGIEQLPPELLRKGRFDAIFFVDLPTRKEREAIFKIHLVKRGQDPAQFPLAKLAEESTGFNGAEIAEVVNDALFSAFSENPGAPALKLKHLLDAIHGTVILATTMKERIEFLRKWAKHRALPAGHENAEDLPQKIGFELAPQERKRNRDLAGG
jgi:SpoVK/Ycf46/Vps4 family AAA+-type ATPase